MNRSRIRFFALCAAILLSACGGGGGGDAGYREAYAKIAKGMKPDEVKSVVGSAPDQEVTANGSIGVICWRTYGPLRSIDEQLCVGFNSRERGNGVYSKSYIDKNGNTLVDTF